MTSPVVNALRAAPFRRLFLAQTISRWGDTFNYVALVILVFRLTGSGLKVAGTVAFEIAPVLVFGFIAGAMVDRLPRQRVMVLADVARAAIAMGLAFSHGSLWAIYLAAFGLSSFAVFFNPAAASVAPALVEEDDVVGANSALWSAAVVSQIVLAPVAGAPVGFAGPGIAFGINAITFLVSATLLVGLRLERAEHVRGKALDDVREGWRVVLSSEFLRGLAIVQALAALSAGATSALLVVLAREHLHVGPRDSASF
jgi:MFS family permease